jgi:putative ABC transport system substrate-binding protein
MRRRVFLAGSGASAVWPLVAAAAPSKIIPKIGIAGTLGPPAVDAFKRGLRDFGFIEGETIVVLGGAGAQAPEIVETIVSDFISNNIDVIFASGAVAGKIAKAKTGTTPIVCLTGDLVGAGLVQSLARPGGNVTGVSFLTSEEGGKRLALLKQLVPALKKVAVLYNAEDASATLSLTSMQAAAVNLRLKLEMLGVHGLNDIGNAISAAVNAEAQGIAITSNPLFDVAGREIAGRALEDGLPTISFTESFPIRYGGLASYGPNILGAFRHAAYFISRILNGARPAELPVEQPTKFDLVINLGTARALNLTVPDTILVSADKVIE